MVVLTVPDFVEWCNMDLSRDGYFSGLMKAAVCAPWVAWIGGNAVVHFTWVGMLLGCQIYQVRTHCFLLSVKAKNERCEVQVVNNAMIQLMQKNEKMKSQLHDRSLPYE